MDIDELQHRLRNLHVDRNQSRYTMGKAPHKAVLLLSLMVLDRHGKVDLDDIHPDIYLKHTWDDLWSVLDYPQPGSITQPLFHMRSEGFWHLSFSQPYTRTSSLKAFQEQLERARLDDGFQEMLQDPEVRNLILNTLLQEGGYFSLEESHRLRARMEELDDSFVYEERLVEQLNREFQMRWDVDVVAAKSAPLAARRDPAFRRMVLNAYEETCAVCGMRVTTASGVSVIDAAHILPFNKFHNDDVRNGLSLCKTHHWLFDRGLLSSDDSYHILVSKDVEEDWPQGVVRGYHHKRLMLPRCQEEQPSELAVRWHCENVFR